MPYTSFAVAGAGMLGARIVQALVDRNASVVVLARPDSKSISNPLLQDVKIATVDYANIQGVSAILRENNVEVLIFALPYPGIQAQKPLAGAAKEANVKLLVPSDFGMPSEGYTEGFVVVKEEFANHVKDLGIPMMRIFVLWLVHGVIPKFAAVEYGKFHLVGDQSLPASFTAMDDVAGFTAHVLTSLPPSSLHNTTFRIQGERISLRAIGALYEACVPPVPVIQVDRLPDGYEKQNWFQTMFARGAGSAGWDHYLNKDVPENASSGNKAWDGHRWKTIKEVLGL
ncbi:hypothetical protein V8B97DRAFT_1919179 [Scleroderma yunnanense]